MARFDQSNSTILYVAVVQCMGAHFRFLCFFEAILYCVFNNVAKHNSSNMIYGFDWSRSSKPCFLHLNSKCDDLNMFYLWQIEHISGVHVHFTFGTFFAINNDTMKILIRIYYRVNKIMHYYIISQCGEVMWLLFWVDDIY